MLQIVTNYSIVFPKFLLSIHRILLSLIDKIYKSFYNDVSNYYHYQKGGVVWLP